MAEVSDQSQEATPEQKDTSTQQETDAKQPLSEVAEQEEPKQLSELSAIIDLLARLGQNCHRTREEIDLLDQNSTQLLLQEYASALAYIPKILQLLHDYRRFAPDFDKRVEALHKGLRQARKDDTALSSEEERVIAACASVRETILAAVGGLEYALAHVRTTTKHLLAIIAYDDDEFPEFAEDHLDVINIALIQGVAFEEESRIRGLKRDVLELRSFEEHVAELTKDHE